MLNSWPKLLSLVPESCCLILAGLAVGFVFYITNTSILSPLSSTIFFFIMLPPIILDAGYFMPNRPFFDHLGTILLFAVMGTIFNTICIGKKRSLSPVVSVKIIWMSSRCQSVGMRFVWTLRFRHFFIGDTHLFISDFCRRSRGRIGRI